MIPNRKMIPMMTCQFAHPDYLDPKAIIDLSLNLEGVKRLTDRLRRAADLAIQDILGRTTNLGEYLGIIFRQNATAQYRKENQN